MADRRAPRRFRIPALVLAAALPAGLASAQPFAANFVGAGLVPLSFPLAPIAAGKFDASLAPAYVRAKTFNTVGTADDSKSVNAYGGAGSLVYGLSDHFALGFLGLGFSGSGTYDCGGISCSVFMPGANQNSYRVKTNGEIVAGSVIWDYFSGDGFRLPILFGLNYESLHDAIDFGAPGNIKNDLNSLGIQGGFSAQFNTGPLRWEPFALVYYPFSREKVTQNGALLSDNIHSDTGGPQPGVNVVYRPWNLSFFYAFGVSKAKGTHVYSLRLAHSFGGKTGS